MRITLFKSIFFLMTAINQLASAVYLDRDVSSFLSAKRNPNSQMSVIITYKATSDRLRLWPNSSIYHGQVERNLMSDLAFNEQRLSSRIFVGRKVRSYWVANSSAVELDAGSIATLANDPMIQSLTNAHRKIKIERSRVQSGLRDRSAFTYGIEKIGVVELLKKYPALTGKNVLIGILDTGVDDKHPDLVGKLAAFKNFSPSPSPLPSDEFGHGTHVSGTLVGGNKSNIQIGIAPAAQLVVGRIFDGNGDSTTEGILAGMQWMADPDGNPNTNDFPSVVNSSWGDSEKYDTKNPEDEPFCVVSSNWVKLGIVPVFASGNTGPNPGTVTVPGACPNSLAVGGTNINDDLGFFSGSGPARWKSRSYLKPDLTAPGIDIFSSKPRNSYEKMTGTSMATPHVSGALALIYQAAPKITVDMAIKALIAGAKDLGNPGPDMDFGYGRINIQKSIEALSTGQVR